MSRIYFHSPNGETEVLGAERAYLGKATHDASIGLLLGAISPWQLRRALARKSVAREAVGPHGVNERMLSLALGTFGDDEPAFVVDGKPVDHWQLLLNTLIQHGGDGMRLAARIHAQCEIHCYVEGPNRAWLSDLIAESRREGLLRADMGWESVAELLDSRADEPVVMSYSVTDQFPNRWRSTWVVPNAGKEWESEDDEDAAREEDGAAWYALPESEKWRMGLEWLRTEGVEKGLRLDPDEWADYRFGHSLTATDLIADGVRAALAEEDQ